MSRSADGLRLRSRRQYEKYSFLRQQIVSKLSRLSEMKAIHRASQVMMSWPRNAATSMPRRSLKQDIFETLPRNAGGDGWRRCASPIGRRREVEDVLI